MEERAASPGGGLEVAYRDALALQERLAEARVAGRVGDLVWLLEHPRTITFGTRGGADHLRAPHADLEARGVDIVPTRRGGDVTCHEPGQLVIYPIVSLRGGALDRDLHAYLRALEEAVIALLGDFGLRGERVDGRTGVWLTSDGPPRKIAAMGVRCSRWVTSHGVALNVRNDLEGFRWIVPCGISDAGVTRLVDEVAPARVPSLPDLGRALHAHLERALDRPLHVVFGADGPAALLADR